MIKNIFYNQNQYPYAFIGSLIYVSVLPKINQEWRPSFTLCQFIRFLTNTTQTTNLATEKETFSGYSDEAYTESADDYDY